MKKKIGYLLMIVLSFTLISFDAKATASATLSLSNISGDNVRVTVTGEPSTSVRLSFLPPGASTMTTIVFGTTDSSGNFSSTISSGGYGIPQGSPVYVTISGAQSSTMLWPSYTSSLTLSKNNVSVAIGQSMTVSGSNSLILPTNGMSSIASTALNGSQLTITGLSSGSGTLWLCGSNVGCGSIAVLVGDQGQAQVSFGENNFTIRQSQSKNIDIYGGTNSGFMIASNSNSSVVSASISGTTRVVSLYGNNPGTATISICSKESTTNCANLVVTILSSSVDNLSFSQNDLILGSGLSQSVTVSGGIDSNYYIASNSNSGIAVATISGNILTVTGGSNAGATTIKVCSTSVNATCGNLNVNLYLNSNTASVTSISFSQNVVYVAKKDTVNVTVSGGNGNGYIISSNSNPSSVTATVTGNTNIVAVYGAETGTSIISVCSTNSSSICASIYVTVGKEADQIYFSPSSVSLKSGETLIVNVNGALGLTKEISSNSNSSVVSATLNSGGSILVLKGTGASGTSAIKICSTLYTTNCATLNVTITPVVTTSTNTSNSISFNGKLIKYSNSSKIYIVENNKKRWIKSEVIFNYFKYKWSNIITVGSDIIYEDGEDLALPAITKFNFTRDLKLNMIGDDVKELQKYLNNHGFIIVASGPGSLGNETTKFGYATREALMKFQKANKISPINGLFGPMTRKLINSK